jgi:hypothetical protein
VQSSNKGFYFFGFFHLFDKALVASKEQQGFSDEATVSFFANLVHEPVRDIFLHRSVVVFVGKCHHPSPSHHRFPKKVWRVRVVATFARRWACMGRFPKKSLPFVTKTKLVKQVWMM